jgi:hypothetical protein
MKLGLFVSLCVGCVFSIGYLAGIRMTEHVVETAAIDRLEIFSHQVNVLEGRVLALAAICD